MFASYTHSITERLRGESRVSRATCRSSSRQSYPVSSCTATRTVRSRGWLYLKIPDRAESAAQLSAPPRASGHTHDQQDTSHSCSSHTTQVTADCGQRVRVWPHVTPSHEESATPTHRTRARQSPRRAFSQKNQNEVTRSRKKGNACMCSQIFGQ